MGTRSTIAILREDGTVKAAYCGSDGYLAHNGVMLYLHYNSATKVEDLLSLGSISYVQENVHPPMGAQHNSNIRFPNVCIFHERDYKSEGVPNKTYTSLEDYIENDDFEEYNYIFNEKKNDWYLIDKSKKLKKVITLLGKDPDTMKFSGEKLKQRKEMLKLNSKLNKELKNNDVQNKVRAKI